MTSEDGRDHELRGFPTAERRLEGEFSGAKARRIRKQERPNHGQGVPKECSSETQPTRLPVQIVQLPLRTF